MGKSSGSSARPVTDEEKRLWDMQTESLKQATEVAAVQFNLSQEDRDYFNQVYRGYADVNDPKVKEEIAKRLADTPKPTREQYTKAANDINEAQLDFYMKQEMKGFDYDSGRSEPSREEVAAKYGLGTTKTTFDEEAYNTAMATWQEQKDAVVKAVQKDMGSEGVDEMLFKAVKQAGGKTQELLNNWETTARELGNDYTSTLGNISKAMGTADEDVYAQTKGQNLAGISQAYEE